MIYRVIGQTYQFRDALQRHGLTWDPTARAWTTPLLSVAARVTCPTCMGRRIARVLSVVDEHGVPIASDDLCPDCNARRIARA